MTDLAITPYQLFKKCDDGLVSDMDGEKVMLSIRSGKYYNFGQTGGRIWELLDQPTTVHDLVSRLTEEYDVDRSVCERHVMSFIGQLLREELVEPVHDQAASGSETE
jgi:hypothetical protein